MKTPVLLLLCMQCVGAYPNGPTAVACEDMRPRHGADRQTSTAPYTITTDSQTYESSQTVTVTVEATDPMGQPFKGFFVQARRDGSDDAIGEFFPGNDTEIGTVSCQSGSNNAISHRSRVNKTMKMFTWRNPDGGDVYFQGTFVYMQPIFWMNVRSDPVRYIGGGVTLQPHVFTLTILLSTVLLYTTKIQ